MRKPPPMRRTLEKPLLSTDNFPMTSTDNRSPFYCKSPRRLRLDGESFGSQAPESRGVAASELMEVRKERRVVMVGWMVGVVGIKLFMQWSRH